MKIGMHLRTAAHIVLSHYLKAGSRMAICSVLIMAGSLMVRCKLTYTCHKQTVTENLRRRLSLDAQNGSHLFCDTLRASAMCLCVRQCAHETLLQVFVQQ
jgi:hypothetical protein